MDPRVARLINYNLNLFIHCSLLHHTNGNGIYNTSHPLLERLTGQLEVEAPCPYNSIPYDYRMSQMWVEGTLGIVPELAPKIMLNEEGQNITLSDNLNMFSKWANRWKVSWTTQRGLQVFQLSSHALKSIFRTNNHTASRKQYTTTLLQISSHGILDPSMSFMGPSFTRLGTPQGRRLLLSSPSGSSTAH